jgi:Reverse transcriptase (RNA-dependent DNA polymerase)
MVLANWPNFFFPKTMEKLIDVHITNKHLVRQPLHSKQFALQAGKSTVSALHHLVRKIENAIKYKKGELAAFIDVEGASDNNGFDSFRAAAQSRHIDPETVEWIIQMPERRIVIARLEQDEIAIKTTKGCPQGGVLSPLLWSFVIDNLLIELEQQGYEVLGFADDLVIIVRGKVDSLISDRLQFALNYATKWCRRTKLNINPRKTIVIPFTRRLKLGLKKPVMDGIEIEFSKETKYLEVVLDNKLRWDSQKRELLKPLWHVERLSHRDGT